MRERPRLHGAIQRGDLPEVQALVRGGACVSEEYRGFTSFLVAVEAGWPDIVQWLLMEGGSTATDVWTEMPRFDELDRQTNRVWGRTAVQLACRRQHFGVAQLLLEVHSVPLVRPPIGIGDFWHCFGISRHGVGNGAPSAALSLLQAVCMRGVFPSSEWVGKQAAGPFRQGRRGSAVGPEREWVYTDMYDRVVRGANTVMKRLREQTEGPPALFALRAPAADRHSIATCIPVLPRVLTDLVLAYDTPTAVDMWSAELQQYVVSYCVQTHPLGRAQFHYNMAGRCHVPPPAPALPPPPVRSSQFSRSRSRSPRNISASSRRSFSPESPDDSPNSPTYSDAE
jgi:hypothetical protein